MYKSIQNRLSILQKRLDIEQLSSLKRLTLSLQLFFLLILYTIIHSFSLLFHKPTTSFVLIHNPSNTGTWDNSYYRHLLYKRRLRIFSSSSLCGIVIICVSLTLLMNVLFPASEIRIARAASFTVTNGNDAGPGSLRQALNDATQNPGLDTINFAIDNATLNLASDLKIGSDTVLDGGAHNFTIASQAGHVFEVKGSQVTVSNLTFKSVSLVQNNVYNNLTLSNLVFLGAPNINKNALNFPQGLTNFNFSGLTLNNWTKGIHFSSASNGTIINSVIFNSSESGVTVSQGQNLTFDNVDIHDNPNQGYYVYNSSSEIHILNSDVYNNRDGIKFDDVSNSDVTGNVLHDNSETGVRVSFVSANNKLSNNTAYNNISGILLSGANVAFNTLEANTTYSNRDGIALDVGTHNNTVTKNIIYSNNEVGITVKDNCANNTLSNNTVYSNLYGIILSGTGISDNMLNNNSVYSNTRTGINIKLGAAKNTVKGNDIYSNGECGISLAQTSANSFMENYVGTKAAQLIDLGNNTNGFCISGGSSNNTIGPDNYIAYNKGFNVSVMDTAHDNLIFDNIIKSSKETGVAFTSGANNNTVGPDNVITDNVAGITVDGAATLNNKLTKNLIYNNSISISLTNSGNNKISAPVLTQIITSNKIVDIQGSVGINNGEVEIYRGDKNGEAKEYLGSVIIAADNYADWSFAKDLTGLTQPIYISALFTSGSNTSALYSGQVTLDNEAPVTSASLPAGTYASAQTVTLTAVDNKYENPKIFYSLDGSIPLADDAHTYTAPILLTKTTTLQFFSGDDVGNFENVQSLTYVITSENEPDTTGPVISDLIINTTNTTATLTFNTNELAVEKIKYKLSTDNSYTETSYSETYLTAHTISLTGLTKNSEYAYIIMVKDDQGNTTTQAVAYFTTSDIPDSQLLETSLLYTQITVDGITPSSKKNPVVITNQQPVIKGQVDAAFKDYLIQLTFQKINKTAAKETVLTDTAKVKTNGIWKYTVTEKLDPGNYQLKLGAADTNQQTVVESKVRLHIDITPPQPEIIFPNNSQVVTQTPAVSGNGVTGTTVYVEYYDLSGNNLANCTSEISADAFSCAPTYALPVGTYQIRARAEAGTLKSSWTDFITFTLIDPNKDRERKDFLITCTESAAGPVVTTNRRPTLTGFAPNATVSKIYDNNSVLGTAVLTDNASGTGSLVYKPTQDLPLGENSIVIKTYNQQGVLISETCPYLIIIQAATPAPSWVFPAARESYYANNALPELKILGRSGTTLEVLVNDNLFAEQLFPDSSTGTAALGIALTLPQGKYTVKIRAHDASGKKSNYNSEVKIVHIYVPALSTPSAPVTPTEPSTPEEPVVTPEEPDNNQNEEPVVTPEDPTSGPQTPVEINQRENTFQELAKAHGKPVMYPLIETAPKVLLTSEEQQALNANLTQAAEAAEINLSSNNNLQNPQFNADGAMVYTYYDSLDLRQAVLEIFGQTTVEPTIQNDLIFSGTIPMTDALKAAGVRGWAIVTIYSDPAVHIAQADENGAWTISVPVNLLPAGEHTAYVQTELNGVRSDQVEIARFVLQEKQRFSNTTIFFIANIIIAILALLIAIFLQLRKNRQILAKMQAEQKVEVQKEEADNPPASQV